MEALCREEERVLFNINESRKISQKGGFFFE